MHFTRRLLISGPAACLALLLSASLAFGCYGSNEGAGGYEGGQYRQGI